MHTAGPTIWRLSRGKSFKLCVYTKYLTLNLLSQTDLHLVRLTVVDDILTLCSANTATTVRLVTKARLQYHNGGTANGDDTNILLLQCGKYL